MTAHFKISPAPGQAHYASAPLAGGDWYAVHTKAQCERLTSDALLRKGFPVYLPMVTKKIRHARQEQIVARPLFHRYLFVSLDPDRPLFSEVRKTHGVEWLVTNLGKPVLIPSKAIERIRQAEEEGLFDETRPKPRAELLFKPGDSVRLLDGPFQDFVAVILSLPSERRIEVILDLFGRKTRMTVPLANVESLR